MFAGRALVSKDVSWDCTWLDDIEDLFTVVQSIVFDNGLDLAVVCFFLRRFFLFVFDAAVDWSSESEELEEENDLEEADPEQWPEQLHEQDDDEDDDELEDDDEDDDELDRSDELLESLLVASSLLPELLDVSSSSPDLHLPVAARFTLCWGLLVGNMI